MLNGTMTRPRPGSPSGIVRFFSLFLLSFLCLTLPGRAQRSSDPSHIDFYSVRLYMNADEALFHMQQMSKTLGGEIRTDDQASVFLPRTRYTRSIVWETNRFTLIADLLQYRRKGKVHEAVVGLSLHPKPANPAEGESWFQETALHYGAATFSSLVGPDAGNSLYFCQTTDGRSCEAERPILILGHNYLLLSDCGFVDRMSDPVL